MRQGDLFAGDNVSGRVGQADAEAALGDIAARTEGPMGGRAAAGAAAAAAQGGNGAAGNHDFEAADPPREVTPETEREDELADARGSARGARGLEKVREFQERRDAETGGAA